MKKSILYFNDILHERQFDLAMARLLLIVTAFLRHRDKIMKRESRGINNFLRDQGSKFSSLLGSRIKILVKIWDQ